jgi:hypothetical protein
VSETKKIKKPVKPTPKNIAKDVLALLKAKKLEALSGMYCSIGDTKKSLDEYHDLQEVLHEKGVVCDVCALGGMMADGEDNGPPSDEEIETARRFGLRYKADDKRLKAICENIIAYGKFRPEKKAAPKKKKAAK